MLEVTRGKNQSTLCSETTLAHATNLIAMIEDDNFLIHGPETDELIPDELLGHYIHNSLLTSQTKNECLIDAFTGATRSYRNILERCCALGQALYNYGIKPNTIVSIASENSLYFCDPLFASLFVGATVAPINYTYTDDELKNILSLYQPQIVFCSSATVGKYVALKKKLGYIKKIILIEGDNVSGAENISSFIKENLGDKVVDPRKFRPFNDADPADHIAFIMSSSGTTGLPKGVMLTDRNILVRVAQARHLESSVRPIFGNKSLGLMPFFHGFGLNFILSSIIQNETVIILKHFDEDVFLRMIQDHKISTIAIAPPLAVLLSKSPKVDKYDLSSVKEIICGAAPMSKELDLALKKRLNLQYVRQGYGLTESNLAVTVIPRKLHDKPGSVGTVFVYMMLKVRDPETGRSLGPKQVGEICIKGPMVMKGYFKNPQATNETFTPDGWLKTGDLGYYDEDKYFYIVDRLKELIKYKGYQVAPAELEAILLSHLEVVDVGVVGAPDELAGELPVAFVVKRPGSNVDENDLQSFVTGKVSPQKRLRGGIFFIDAIPKNMSGKILRRDLRQHLAALKVKRESKL